DFLGEPLIADPAFEASLVAWQQAGLVSQDPDEPGGIVLESINPKAGTYLRRDLDLPPGDTLLILRAQVQGDDVVTGLEPWDSARIYLAQLDDDGQPDWKEDHNLFNLNGTTDVRNYRRAFTIPAEIETVRLGIEMKNATGRLTVSQLELIVADYKTTFQVAVSCLLLAWSALVLYTAIKTFGGIESVRIRLWLGVLSVLSVVALMLPGGTHDIGTEGIAAQFGIDDISVDTIGHGVMFTALAFLVRLGRPFDPYWLHIGVWMLIAIASEVLQLFTVGRDPSLDDLWLDGVGIFLGLALAEITLRMRRSVAT
ncbi:MAG: VanZ family protein, partial [Alphaproteobacteria bacterium]|nr:VanZ family protein [Alphaproteobacteria bacterium]